MSEEGAKEGISSSEQKESNKNTRFLDGVKDIQGSTRVMVTSFLLITGYFLLGALIYSVWIDDLEFIDALYFSAVTASTVGYGDVLPKTDGQKIFTVFFLIIGVVFVLGIAVTLLVDDLFDAVNRAKSSARQVGELHILNKFTKKHSDEKNNTAVLLKPMSRLSAYGRVLIKDSLFIGACFIPPIIFAFVEKWSVVDTIYYTVVTFTTVGYGDLSPKNTWTRLAATFYVPFSVVIFARIFSSLSNVYMTRKTKEAERKFLSRKLTKEDLLAMDIDSNGTVTKDEYLTFMLIIMGKVDSQFIDKLRGVFDTMDTDQSGTLTIADLLKIHHQNDAVEAEDDDDDKDGDDTSGAVASDNIYLKDQAPGVTATDYAHYSGVSSQHNDDDSLWC